MDKIISSRTNPAVQMAKKVRDGDDPKLIFCEGERLLEDLLRSHWALTQLFVLKSKHVVAKKLLSRYQQNHVPITEVSDAVMAAITDHSTAPGLVALAKRTPSTGNKNETAMIVLHGVQQPLNVGNVIRTAEAAGVGAVWLTQTSADPFGVKTVRGSMGSALRVPIESGLSFESALTRLKEKGLATVAATQEGRISYTEFDWKKPFALILGAEGKGLTDDELSKVETTIKIPMKGLVESLNIGSAAAICLFEAARQREK